jgi:hypothetical protein
MTAALRPAQVTARRSAGVAPVTDMFARSIEAGRSRHFGRRRWRIATTIRPRTVACDELVPVFTG